MCNFVSWNIRGLGHPVKRQKCDSKPGLVLQLVTLLRHKGEMWGLEIVPETRTYSNNGIQSAVFNPRFCFLYLERQSESCSGRGVESTRAYIKGHGPLALCESWSWNRLGRLL
ncbi:uncharacterized protein LOC144810903 [Lissotriton helveticus]